MKRTPLDVHLNLNVRGMPNSATVAIHQRCQQLRREGHDVIGLGLGQSPFPVPEPVVEALRRHAAEKDYLPVRGLPALREAVAAYHARVDGVERDAEDVLIGPGSKELMFLLQLVYYGDLVIPTPAWVSYAPQARIIGRRVQLIHTREDDGWQLSADGLARLCREDTGRPRIVVLNYPSNPTGGTYRLEELRALARAAREHRVVLLSDEIYGPLHHRGQHVSIARFYPEGTIVSSGLSKWCGAGGWRLGTFSFPSALRWLLDAMASAASETFTSTSAPIQYAAVTAFNGSDVIDDYLRRARRALRAIGHGLVGDLRAAGLACADPLGGFYLFPDFSAHAERLAARGIHGSRQLAERILEDIEVGLLPGQEFGRPDEELLLRIAYVDFDGAGAQAAFGDSPRSAAEAIARARRVAPRLFEAVERLSTWLAAGPSPD